MSDDKLLQVTSAHYLSGEGRSYFSYQNQGGLQQGAIEARKFAKFVSATDTVIDFGCGSGATLAMLPCMRRIGVEINPAAREECVKNQIEVYAMLDEIPNGIAQVMITNHALEHVPNPLATLIQMREKLTPNGRLYVCVPIDDWRTEKQIKLDDINRHLYTWTPLLLGNLLDEAGFRVQNVRILTHAWPPYWQKLDRYMPTYLFDLICRIYSFYKKRRQIFAEVSNSRG